MKINVGVFFGGVSCEHEISCISANQVLKALDPERYEIIPVYISKDYDLNNLCSSLDKICIYKDQNRVYIKPLKSTVFGKKEKPIDVAFPVMHGTHGEDGCLQGLFEMLNLPYTSSDVLASALGQDKAVMKIVLKSDDIPMVPWFYFWSHEIDEKISELKDKASKIGYPLIAKPANLGSSIGIQIIHDENELEEKLKEAASFDFKIVVEKMITQLKECNISVMGSLYDCKVSAIEEVYKNDEMLSFKDKYEGGSKSAKGGSKDGASKGMASTSRKVPAVLKDGQQEFIEDLAKRTFKVLGAKGCVRIDFMIDEADDSVYVNEINSIPGSLAYYLWSEKGLDFVSECDELLNNALKVYREKEKKVYSFSTNILSNYRRK